MIRIVIAIAILLSLSTTAAEKVLVEYWKTVLTREGKLTRVKIKKKVSTDSFEFLLYEIHSENEESNKPCTKENSGWFWQFVNSVKKLPAKLVDKLTQELDEKENRRCNNFNRNDFTYENIPAEQLRKMTDEELCQLPLIDTERKKTPYLLQRQWAFMIVNGKPFRKPSRQHPVTK